MKSNRVIFYLLGFIVLILLVQIVRSSFSNPGTKAFEGKFEELGFYRNENNTGPVLRVYAIRALDTDIQWMREFADAQPHTKYGRTLVFFFTSDIDEKVSLSPQEPFFPEELQPYLLAKFEKTPMGEGRFTSEVQ
ncbi:hypothetical protein GCM10009119_36730 [Algoriphagus jejuensis]|uniref:Uncharacterized protein n=1 Tax=Algoriphagus jejuensis TaxID=419934 RepID=A0ABP3YIR6_9BACT